MPYVIVENDPRCKSGYAVLKETTREMMGCHPTLEKAKLQQAALYASEPEARSGERTLD